MGFPDGSDGKESACNAGDAGSIPGLGKSPGGGHGNPLQYLAWRIPMDRGAWQATVHGFTKSLTQLSNFTLHPFVRFSIFCFSQVAQWQRVFLPVQEPQETWVHSLGWEDPLEEEMATHSNILVWENPMDRGAWLTALADSRELISFSSWTSDSSV